MPIRPFILFDGVCNLCDRSIQFILKKSKNKKLMFAPFQTQPGRELAMQFGISPTDLQSFVFVENGRPYKKSTAALKVCRHLGGAWPLLYVMIIVPRVIRDGIYDFIARNRYRWFGKKTECMIPSDQDNARFIN